MIRTVFILFCLLLFGCSDIETKYEGNDLANFSLETPKYAKGFKVFRNEHSTIIRVLDIADTNVVFDYVIGKSTKNSQIELKYKNQRVIPLSATHVGMMNELNQLRSIVAIPSFKYLCDVEKFNELQLNDIPEVGDLASANLEMFLKVNPDLIIISGFDLSANALKKIEAVGLKTFVNFDWKETHPLGRAEWIKVFGILLDCESLAEKSFSEIEQNYNQLISGLESVEVKPSVLVGTLYGDIFNAPAGNSYFAKLLKDAKTNYVYENTSGVGSLSLTLEEVITKNKKTEFWINMAAKNHQQLFGLNEKFKVLNAVENGNLYSYYEQVNCFWEEAAVRPDKVLEDLIKIFHFPENQNSFNFYNKLVQDNSITD